MAERTRWTAFSLAYLSFYIYFSPTSLGAVEAAAKRPESASTTDVITPTARRDVKSPLRVSDPGRLHAREQSLDGKRSSTLLDTLQSEDAAIENAKPREDWDIFAVEGSLDREKAGLKNNLNLFNKNSAVNAGAKETQTVSNVKGDQSLPKNRDEDVESKQNIINANNVNQNLFNANKQVNSGGKQAQKSNQKGLVNPVPEGTTPKLKSRPSLKSTNNQENSALRQAQAGSNGKGGDSVQKTTPVTSTKSPPLVMSVPSSTKEDMGTEFLRRSEDFKVNFVSSAQGILQSPKWGNGDNYPAGLNIWERVVVPDGKLLHVAVQYLNLLEYSSTDKKKKNNNKNQNTLNHQNNNLNIDNNSNNRDCNSVTEDVLSVYLVNESNSRTLLWTACRSGRPPPVIRETHAVDFHFSSKNRTYDTGPYAAGFQLWLTFLDAGNASSATDLQARRPLTTTWPWPDFQGTLRNLPPADFCQGEGSVWVGGICLKMLTPGEGETRRKSWTDVDKLCRQENATLPSPTTPREWRALVDYVSRREFQVAGGSVKMYVGLRFWNASPPGYEHVPLYEGFGRWSTGSVAFFLRDVHRKDDLACSAFMQDPLTEVSSVDCDEINDVPIICQIHTSPSMAKIAAPVQAVSPRSSTPPSSSAQVDKKSQDGLGEKLVKCPKSGHFMQAYMACDLDCYGKSQTQEEALPAWKSVFQNPLPSKSECPVPLPSQPPYFTCDLGTHTRTQRVPFTLVCNGLADCLDASDETFCKPFVCSEKREKRFFACAQGWQCIEASKQCDGQKDCRDGSDESPKLCLTAATNSQVGQDAVTLTLPSLLSTLPPPVLIGTNRHGRLTLRALHVDRNNMALNDVMAGVSDAFLFACPAESHFRCSQFCMPVYLRCNGVRDCPQGEDEASCSDEEGVHLCPSLYRCRSSFSSPPPTNTAGAVKVCVHPDNVCDGVYHCPSLDDEDLCNLSCPGSCSCHYGHVFFCSSSFEGWKYPNLRYLYAPESGMQLGKVSQNSALVYLNLASCGISSVEELSSMLFNLRTLDLSENKIRELGVQFLSQLPALRDLSLRNNPLTFPFTAIHPTSLPSLERLDLSMVWINRIQGKDLSGLDLHNLQILNLSYSGLEVVDRDSFHSLVNLRMLDLRGCPLNEFTEDSFSQLSKLSELYGSRRSLCCPGSLPGGEDFHGVCSVPKGSTTICGTLLHSNAYRLILIVFASLILGGNVISFIYRLIINQDERDHSCGVMVYHLCVSDFLMGIYLVILGVADSIFGSSFFIHSERWKGSAGCKVAGFVSLLSCEASAFFVCLLTIDRLAALRFPNSRLHFRKRSAQLTCTMTWFASVFLAVVPLIETHWRFYGQKETCLPLPTDAQSFDGRDFSFGVLIMLNFLLFLVIAVGQALIFCAVRSKRKTLGFHSEYQSLERSIAKRLIVIALTDFLVWFPVCLVGFLASNGVSMPSHTDTALSIVVLPLNSAINPFIYTFIMVKDSRQKKARDFLESETTFMM